MKTSIYHRLDHLPSADLRRVAEMYEELDAMREPKPTRMNWYQKIALRARVILATRHKARHSPIEE